MATKAQLERRIALLQTQLDSVLEELESAVDLPDEDPFEDGTVLRFDKRFTRGPGTAYSYAVIRYRGLWSTTGPNSPKSMTWGQLATFLSSGVDLSEVQVASRWKQAFK